MKSTWLHEEDTLTIRMDRTGEMRVWYMAEADTGGYYWKKTWAYIPDTWQVIPAG